MRILATQNQEKRSSINPNEVFRSALKIKERKIKIKISKLPSCMGDPVQINQVFSNLIDNSIKYLSPNRLGVIKISGKKEKDNIIYCIEDNGIGIQINDQKEIFKIFKRLNSNEESGEGLGLTIAKDILARHKGKIWFVSEFRKGSRFYISLHSINE